jgi:hypothetical protein
VKTKGTFVYIPRMTYPDWQQKNGEQKQFPGDRTPEK